MSRSITGRAFLLACFTLLASLAPVGAHAEDRPVDRDWRTGVPLPPNAHTWMDNAKEKQSTIAATAALQGKACSHYAFIGWPPGSGGAPVIMQGARANYEAAGFVIKPGRAEVASTDTVWIASHPDGREAVILWGAPVGSTIYLSCLTGGDPAADPLQPLYIGVLLAFGLGCLGAGLWLIQRQRALGLASTTWPTAPGTIRSSEVVAQRTLGAHQFITRVEYDYTVGGKPLRGDRLRFGQIAAARPKAEADAARYPAGAGVPVYYAPRQPETSTLEPGIGPVSISGVVLAGLGTLLTILAVLLALSA